MAYYMDIAEKQNSLESSVIKMLSEFEAKLSRQPVTKVTTASLNEEFCCFREHTLTVLKLLRSQITVFGRTQDTQEMRHRRKYLLFNGIPEDPAENVSTRVATIISDKLKISDVSAASFKACHRLGKVTEGRSRPILVRFKDMHLKSLVWKKKTSFKGTAYAISEFLTPRRQALFMQARKAFGMRSCWSLDGNIFVKVASGVRERIDSDEDIERLKDSRDKQPSSSSPALQPGQSEVRIVTATAAPASGTTSGPSDLASRPRRAPKS